MSFNTARRATRLLVAAALTVSCGGDDGNTTGPAVPADIIIIPNHPTVGQGQDLTLTATVIDATGHAIAGESVEFSSSDETIATVDANGLVHSVGPLGTVQITADDDGLTNSVDLRVTRVVGGLSVTPDPLVLNNATSGQLSVVVVDYVGDPISTPGSVVYSSSRPALATVDANGLVTAGASLKGDGVITVVADTFVAHVTVTVTQIPSSMSVTPASILLKSGGSRKLVATVLDAVGQPIDNAPVTFVSSAPTIFSVSTTGVVRSLGPRGNGGVTVTSGSFTQVVGVFVGSIPQGKIVHTTPLHGGYAAAVTSSGIVVVTEANAELAIGNIANYQFPTIVTLPGEALGVTVNAAGTLAYVALRTMGAVAIVDLTTNTIQRTIPGFATDVFSVVLSPDERFLFVGTDSKIYKMNTTTFTSSSTAAAAAIHLAVHPSKARLYASMYNAGTVVEINTNTMTPLRTFAPGGTPQGVAVSSDGTMLYVAREFTNSAVSYQLSDGSPGPSFQGTSGGGFGLVTTSTVLVLTQSSSGYVDVFDRGSGLFLYTIQTHGTPRRPAIDASGTTMVVPNEAGWVDFIK